MTLIEIMISLTIFAFIALAVYQATSHTFKLKRVVQRDADFFGTIRIAMTILERDLTGLFSPVAFVAPTPMAQGSQFQSNVNTNNPNGFAASSPGSNPSEGGRPQKTLPGAMLVPTDYWLGANEPMGIRYSRFVGEQTRLRFVTNLHERVYQGAMESTFARIAYELKPDPDSKDSTSILIRIESANAFDDTDKKDLYLKQNEIADRIKTLKFRYYSSRKKNWQDTWDTNSDGEKFEYPAMIECDVTFESKEKSQFSGKFVFQPGYPYNGLGKTF